MNFWERVDTERDYKNMTRKELAGRAGFSLTSLSTGITRGSIPAADVALRIAKVLDVSIEYLLTGDDGSAPSSQIATQSQYAKYRPLITALDALPPDVQQSVITLVDSVREAVPKFQSHT